MEMQSPGERGGIEAGTSISGLFEQLVEDSRYLVKAEARIAEAKLMQRVRLAAIPATMFAAGAALALAAIIAAGAAIAIVLAPMLGWLAATLSVVVLYAACSVLLANAGRQRLKQISVASRFFGTLDESQA